MLLVLDAETLPNSDQELALYMQLKYKPGIEIAEEEAINTILDENHYNDTRKRFDYDYRYNRLWDVVNIPF
jgi:hypothetical protein